MPKTFFRPQIDGSRFEFIEEIGKNEIHAARRKFRSAVDDSIELLEPFYSAALEIYDIRNSLIDSVAGEIPPDFILKSGKIHFILDYYNARRFSPKSVPKKENDLALINSFFRGRSADSLGANAAVLLANTAIVYMIPDKWLPESWIIDPIKKELKQMDVLKDSTVDLTLRVPFGGNLWLRDKCRQEWDQLKRYLDDGKPWPIRLIGASLNPYENEAVIAYGYKEHDDGSGTIYVYDLEFPGQEQALKLKFHGKTQITVEGFEHPSDDSIRGFYCEHYSEQSPPAIGKLLFFRKILPIKPIWYITRLTRLFGLRMRSLMPHSN